MCSHLKPLENYLIDKDISETFRGQPWSTNCREWIYFDAILEPQKLKEKFDFDDTICVHDYIDNKVGSELGLVCNACKDGIMGVHPQSNYAKSKKIIH